MRVPEPILPSCDGIAISDPSFLPLPCFLEYSAANDLNKPSVNAALRLGFILETPVSLRADRGLSPGQVGAYTGRDGDPLSLKGAKVGRNTAMLSITAEEWETKTREHVLGLINRYK